MASELYYEPHEVLRALFGGRDALHPSLAEKYPLGPDIYEPLFAGIFTHEPFTIWEIDEDNWQLRFNGSPGCGKTTVAALAARNLREKYSGERDAVASIFVRSDALWNEAAFIEDLLLSLFHQLCAPHTVITHEVDDGGNGDDGEKPPFIRDYRKYYAARCSGQRNATRITLIRQAVQSRLATLDHAFLVLDGADRWDSAVDLFLEEEFPHLRRQGLRIMTTSRIPCLKQPYEDYTCDGDACMGRFISTNIHWECQRCHVIILCRSCHEESEYCKECEQDGEFIQPYGHIDRDMSIVGSDQLMNEFVAWSLEREHGDLGLGSRQDKPPLSSLGRELLALSPSSGNDNATAAAAWAITRDITSRASDNMALARARLDLVHQPGSSAESVMAVGDRLPPNIVALFDAGIARIEAQPPLQRELGLKAIAAVAAHPYDPGPLFKDLERWLRESSARPATTTNKSEGSVVRAARAMAAIPHRSLEEVLCATQGFLVAAVKEEPTGGETRWRLEAFHDDFHIYASERYHEGLSWAMAQLTFDEKDRFGPKRSSTFQAGIEGAGPGPGPRPGPKPIQARVFPTYAERNKIASLKGLLPEIPEFDASPEQSPIDKAPTKGTGKAARFLIRGQGGFGLPRRSNTSWAE